MMTQVGHWMRGLTIVRMRNWPGFTRWMLRASTAETRHRSRKLLGTLRLLWCLGAARMLGEYEHSGWNGEFPYARYRWRDRSWIIPTGPMENDE